MAEPPVPVPAPILSAPPLVGRVREQAVLREALAAALTGQGSLVLIGGEAGIGKTTIAEMLCAEASAQGALVLVGRCYDLSETPPYGPWLEITAQSPVGAPGLPPLPAVVTDRAALAAIPSQAALFDQVIGWFVAVATARPLVLLLDDLHWADPASLDLLRALARRVQALPLLLLGTYRADELTRRHTLYQLLPTLERESRAVRLDLRPLGVEGVAALVAARYALPVADRDRLATWLIARAEGNAFFTAQLLRALEDDDVLARDDRWTLGDLRAVRLPTALRQVLDARLARLDEEDRRLLALAAVIGQEVPLALWAAVGEADEDHLLDVVERAVDARLLAESPDGGAVRFAHALIREALYEQTLATRRRRVHRRVGEVLAALPRPDPDAVAYHLQRAGDDRAGAWLVRAGERAHRAYAWLTAADRFEAALALLGEEGEGDEARALLLLRLAILRRYADPVRALACVDEAARWAARAADAPLGAFVTFYRGLLHCLDGDQRRGVAALAAGVAALEALPPAGEARRRALCLAVGFVPGGERGTLAMWLATVGRYAEAQAHGERAAADAPDPAKVAGYGASSHADAYLALLRSRANLGDPAGARRAYARARDLYRAVGHLINVGNNARHALREVALPYHADDLPWRRHLADEADAAYIQAGESLAGYPPGLARATLLITEGHWSEVTALMAQATALPPWMHTGLGEVARARGDWAGAWSSARAFTPGGPAAAPGGIRHLPALEGQRLAAALALDAGDLAEARAWLEAHDRWLAWSGAVLGLAEGHLGWAAYHRAAGDLAQARQSAESALACATEPRQPLALLAAHRALGEIDTVAGRRDRASAHLAEALALAEACAAPYERALTLLALAELRTVSGAPLEARAVLDEARAILEPLSAHPALARAESLAARLLGSPVPAAPVPTPGAHLAGLSAREVEVLRLVAQGLANAQVAERLFLSPRTVGQHLRSIYNKLGVDNRTAAAHFAAEHGLA